MPSTYNQDRFRKEGAEVLARTIQRKWREKGCEVKVWVEPLTDMTAISRLAIAKRDEPLYVVRSDMVNGLPRVPVAALLAVGK